MEESDLDRADAIVEELTGYTYPKEQMNLLEVIKMAVLKIDEDILIKVIDQWNLLINRMEETK